jgi:predicted ATPase
VERVTIRRLGREGTAALMAVTFGEEVSGEFSNLVHRSTDGNPFFTREVLRDVVERGDVFREDGTWNRRSVKEFDVPESVRAVIGQRVSRLSEEAQGMLHEATILGQTFSFRIIQRLERSQKSR